MMGKAAIAVLLILLRRFSFKTSEFHGFNRKKEVLLENLSLIDLKGTKGRVNTGSNTYQLLKLSFQSTKFLILA